MLILIGLRDKKSTHLSVAHEIKYGVAMDHIFRAKLIKVGKFVGILIPKQQLDILQIGVGDTVDAMLMRHRKRKELEKEINETFGMAKHFIGPFERDKRTREF